MKESNMSIDYLLYHKLTRLSQYVDVEHLNDIKKAFTLSRGRDKDILVENESEVFIHFLFTHIQNNIQEAKKITLLLQDFRKQLSHTSTVYDREKVILEYAYTFNPSKIEQHKDQQAFKRWFDEDALAERIQTRISYIHRHSIVSLERILMSMDVLISQQEANDVLWERFDFNSQFLQLLQYRQEPLLTHEIFRVLVNIAQYFKVSTNTQLIDERLFRFIYRIALSTKEGVWVQNDAIEFLASTQLSFFLTVAKIRSADYTEDDSIFVRHKIASLAFKYVEESDLLLPLIKEVILKDPSPYVRQAISKALPSITHPQLHSLKEMLILNDPDKSVRALSITQSLKSIKHQKEFQTLIWRSLLSETDPFVLKTSLFCIGKLVEQSIQSHLPDTLFISFSLEKLSSLMQTDIPTSLKRYTAMTREFVWVCSSVERYTLYQELYVFVQNIPVGQGEKLPKKLSKINEEELYRILSVVAQNDFSLELKRTLWNGFFLYRSERFGRRLWRILYEFFNPSPDKRQAFMHTIARIFEGTHHFPSSILAEQAPTKVPGEPYYIPEEESWRPYLPLPDHFLSSLTQSTLRIHPYKIYSSDGVTSIQAPKFFLNRIRISLTLSWNYAKIAKLRNWKENSTEAPSAYIAAMRKLGFKTSFSPYIKEDKSSTKFFSLALPLLPISPDIQEAIGNYFISAYENTLSDLGLFLIIVFSFFFIRHVIISHKITKARKNIPLSIGGWGTRGKSGTERLKAALFNSLGLKVFSKTTGNEAMFLHADSFERMREIHLFRPYDKATIWEQADTVLLADKLHVDVYLWESMGLTPSYVEVLQKRWMKDDIATITNTYPDHEDLQGPAGINIPQVMTNFIPEHSTLVTSEEVMYPILKAYAKSVHTKSFSTGWLEAGLIAPDILSRFPYEEHPHNIALVLGMAEQLDINTDEALKAMADNIVPDLGVLKAYPSAHINKRILLFINGMSANERFGALGNWQRMGLDKIDDNKEPHTFISTVINNRADRISRSRVFASMLVEDIVADCHILIGSNLSGFHSYLEQAWLDYRETLSLAPGENHTSSNILMNYAKKFRILRSPNQLKQRLEIMLDAYGIEKEKKENILQQHHDLQALKPLLEEQIEIFHFYTRFKEEYEEFEDLLHQSEEKVTIDTLDQNFRTLLWKWLKSRVIPVTNYHATGNEIIKVISQHTPPGMQNKIIGMQNIKGTGLDFAYRWVAWNDCYQMCQAIQSTDSTTIRQGVDALAAFNEHGPLSLELTQKSIDIAKKSIATQNEYYQAQIQLIESMLEDAKQTSLQLTTEVPIEVSSLQKLLYKILEITESFLDSGDSIKRKKKVNRIYKDLIHHHISHKRAALELQKITKRQKGGWLVQKFEKRLS